MSLWRPYNCKERHSKFTVREILQPLLYHRLTPQQEDTPGPTVPSNMTNYRHNCFSVLAENAQDKFNSEKTSDKFKLGGILHHKGLVCLASFKVMKDEERMRIYPRLEEMKSEVDPRLETEPERGHEVESTVRTRVSQQHHVRVCVLLWSSCHSHVRCDYWTRRYKVQLNKFRVWKVTKRSR